MDKNLLKPGRASKNLNNLLIIFLLFAFLVATGALILKYAISQRLDQLSHQLREPAQNQEVSGVLLDLNRAENDFQQASLYGHSDRLEDYKLKLNNIFGKIETVLKKYRADSARYFRDSRQHIKQSIELKIQISQEVFRLKHQFDSLLTITTAAAVDAQLQDDAPAIVYRGGRGRLPDTTLTIKQTNSNKGLFTRLKDAITNKNQSSVKIVTIRREKRIKDSVARSFNKKNKKVIGKLLKQLNEQNNRLMQSNKQLIAANLSLLGQLHQLLQQLKDINQDEWQKNNGEVLNQYQIGISEMNTFTGGAIITVLVFIILLIVYVRKAAEAEQNYFAENARAVALAERKSEILAILSHEIRNPLTVITGNVYLLGKGALSADQQKRLGSIKLSSTMLMETINNILDVSKMDQQHDIVFAEAVFDPQRLISEALETMRFMAENKGIWLKAEFTGDAGATVSGDAFRLKQIMINLLSNAIKYTDKGGVTVKAGVHAPAGQMAELEVSVVDTGIGIPKEKQAKLFTRYYQASGDGVKPGTGLGLYICRELVSQQKGSIRIDSDAGKGCCITFSIPYKKG